MVLAVAVEVVEEVVVSGGGSTSSLALSLLRMTSISAAHPQVRASGDGLGEAMAPNSEASTRSSTQKATSNLSSRVPFILAGSSLGEAGRRVFRFRGS